MSNVLIPKANYRRLQYTICSFKVHMQARWLSAQSPSIRRLYCLSINCFNIKM